MRKRQAKGGKKKNISGYYQIYQRHRLSSAPPRGAWNCRMKGLVYWGCFMPMPMQASICNRVGSNQTAYRQTQRAREGPDAVFRRIDSRGGGLLPSTGAPSEHLPQLREVSGKIPPKNKPPRPRVRDPHSRILRGVKMLVLVVVCLQTQNRKSYPQRQPPSLKPALPQSRNMVTGNIQFSGGAVARRVE